MIIYVLLLLFVLLVVLCAVVEFARSAFSISSRWRR